MGPEATAALVGAGVGAVVGAVIGFAGEWLRDVRRESADSRAAAKMIVAELVTNASTIDTGWGGGPLVGHVRQAAWDAYGSALVRKAEWTDLGTIAKAYSAAHDALWVFNSDLSEEGKNELLEKLVGEVVAGLRQAMLLAGQPPGGVEHRLAAVEEMSKKWRDEAP